MEMLFNMFKAFDNSLPVYNVQSLLNIYIYVVNIDMHTCWKLSY